LGVTLRLPLSVGFKSIRSLILSGISTEDLDVDVLSAFFCNFSAAVDLRLDDVYFESVGQFVRVVCSFPSLQRLAVTGSRIRSDEFGFDLQAPMALRLSPHLRVLELDDACMDAVLDWFLSLPDRPALRAVGLDPIHTNNSSTISNLLLTLEDSLESFLISTTVADGMFMIFSSS
jgi:hypothetical protein